MKNKWLILVVITVVVGFSKAVQALPAINGSISFVGGFTVNNTGLSDATAVTGYSSLGVLGGSASGSYSALNAGGNFGNTLSFSTFSFGGNNLSISGPLWTLTLSGITYSFNATSVTIANQGSNFLNLTGNGIAHITGDQDTAGTWTISNTGTSGPTFSFGASTTVPEGGVTMMLLGTALSGLAFLRRKLVI